MRGKLACIAAALCVAVAFYYYSKSHCTNKNSSSSSTVSGIGLFITEDQLLEGPASYRDLAEERLSEVIRRRFLRAPPHPPHHNFTIPEDGAGGGLGGQLGQATFLDEEIFKKK